ncbi:MULTISPECIES: TonB-dependent siderophore receptor [unclassified Halanaerobium]|uniref:TonB-dependent receptor plug domain-containing protein n=1 Tax=unclassified Halanaerobium TaxID=2641197 RepID=UPI000E135902|nr:MULTISPECIES: TonB-dependent receptor [unclassified Halanaerobium]RCW41153.1 outer membrane receptor for ferrienterochelin and colicins [Halanaerobium sp. MA284_MarDTE_T2]RCW89385.1 outer membrane receptor for ferrienterochelin and colicins [Halanaerobium sp. DL-01]
MKKLVLVVVTAVLLSLLAVITVNAAEEEVINLKEVVVTASKYEEDIMETAVSIEVIDEQEIEESAANNVAELLQSTGSIHIKDKGGVVGQKDVIIRGMRGRQILILIDGQPYNNPNDGSLRLESIPVEFIKKIEVLKSPSSAVYGANAMGGVINIITKDADDFKKTNLKLEAGSFDTQKYSISHSFSGDNSSLTLIYDKLLSDGHRDNSSLDREDLFLKYNYNISNYSDITLSFKNNDSETDYPGQDADYLPEGFLAASSGSREDNDQNVNLTFNQKLENKDRKISIYNNDRELTDLSWDTVTDISKKGISINETYYLKNHTLSCGLDLTENKVKKDAKSSDYEEKNNNKAIFIQDKMYYKDKTIFNIGGRYDDHEVYGSEFSPRLGIVYKISDQLSFNANAAESFRAPTFVDLYYPGFSNPDLEPEKAESLDIGFKHQTQKSKKELTFFNRNVEKMILLDGSYIPQNIDSDVEMNGFEILYSRKINDKFDFDVNYTYLDTKEENSSEQIGDMPYHTLNMDMTYQMSSIKFILNNRYTGERTDYNSKEDMPSHFVSDLKIIKNINEDNKLSLSINNIFDEEYEVVDGYPMPERNYMLTLSTKF